MVSPAWLVPVRPPPGGLRGCARFACYALWPFRRGHSRRNGVFSSLGCCPKSSRLSTLVINGKRGFIRGASPCGQQVQKRAHGGAEYTCALIKQADAALHVRAVDAVEVQPLVRRSAHGQRIADKGRAQSVAREGIGCELLVQLKPDFRGKTRPGAQVLGRSRVSFPSLSIKNGVS